MGRGCFNLRRRPAAYLIEEPLVLTKLDCKLKSQRIGCSNSHMADCRSSAGDIPRSRNLRFTGATNQVCGFGFLARLNMDTNPNSSSVRYPEPFIPTRMPPLKLLEIFEHRSALCPRYYPLVDVSKYPATKIFHSAPWL